MPLRRILPLLVVLTSVACANTRAGTLHPDLIRVARTAKPHGGIKIRTDERGRVTKFAVYHGDPEQVPNFVEGLAKEKFGDVEVRSYENEVYADVGMVYEIEVVLEGGKHCELSVTQAGAERYLECEVPESELPAEVRRAIQGLLPGGVIEEAERKDRPKGEVTFTVEVKSGESEYYLVLAESGRVEAFLLRIPAVLEVPVDRG